jgi:hypothetical protein
VPEDELPGDTHPLQDGVQRQSDGGHCRLADLRLREPLLRLTPSRIGIQVRAERSTERLMQIGAERLVEAIERLAKCGNLLVHLPQQPDLLRSLSREQQNEVRVRERTLRERDALRQLHRAVRRRLRLR